MDLSAVVDLQKVIEAEKKKTTLLMMRIANLCIVLGVLIFIALTVSASVSYFDRSSSTLVIGYGMVLFLIGCGVAILSVYKPDVNTCKSNNALSGINFGSGLVIGSPYLRQPNELSKTVQEFEGWFVFFGASILTASSFMIPAEIATMSLGFAQYIRTVRYSKGLTIGSSQVSSALRPQRYEAERCSYSRCFFLFSHSSAPSSTLASPATTMDFGSSNQT